MHSAELLIFHLLPFTIKCSIYEDGNCAPKKEEINHIILNFEVNIMHQFLEARNTVEHNWARTISISGYIWLELEQT